MEAVALEAAVCRGRAGFKLPQGVNLVQRLCLAAFFLQERQKNETSDKQVKMRQAPVELHQKVKKPHRALLSAGGQHRRIV